MKRLPVIFAGLLAATPALAAKHVHAAHVAAPKKLGITAAPSGPPPTPDSPAGDKATPAPPILPGFTSYVVMDGRTGAILAEAAPALQVPPASLTKLMTAHLAYQALRHGSLKSDQVVTVSPDAWHAPGSRMFIDPTMQVTVDQLLHGLLIDSGNDAAIALAEQIAGSQDAFVQLMVQTGQKLGLADTTYVNVTGLPDPALHTTAMDVAHLSMAILRDEPEILNITKQQSYTFNGITQASWNPVLAHDDTVDGLKTGLTEESGHCIDATALRHGMRLIAVVMGGTSWHASTAAVESLLNYGERNFADAQFNAGTAIGTLKVPAIESGSVDVGPQHDVQITVPADAANKVTASIDYTTLIRRGVHAGEMLGTATFMLDGKAVGSVPVVALESSPRAGFYTRWRRKIEHAL